MLKFRNIFIMLGKACNENCQYCIQQSMVARKYNGEMPVRINPEIIDYIEKVCQYRMDDRLNLLFLGGEPMIYWEQIKAIVEAVEARNKPIRFSLITNGTLLDREKVGYINKHDIGIDLSFDGVNVLKTRQYDIFETSAGKFIYQLNNLTLEAVVTKDSYPMDILSRAKEINKKRIILSKPKIEVLIEPLVVLEQCAGYEILDRHKMADQWYSIIKTAHKEPIEPDDVVVVSAYASSIANYVTARNNGFKSVFGLCPDEYTSLHMDIAGNLHACHNIVHKIGTIHDTVNTLFANMAVFDESFHFDRARCEGCEIINVCKDMCRLHENSDKYCEYLRAYFGSIKDAMDKWEAEGNTLKGADAFCKSQ